MTEYIVPSFEDVAARWEKAYLETKAELEHEKGRVTELERVVAALTAQTEKTRRGEAP